MAICVWTGNAQKIAQVTKVTPDSVEVDDVMTLTINDKAISVTATANTAANVIGLMITAIQASDIPEFKEVTPTDGTTYLILTGPSSGKPVTVDGSADGTGTFEDAELTAAVSPNHVSHVDNWDTGVPTDGDTIIFDSGTRDCLYDLDALTAVSPAAVHIKKSYTGNIGLPPENTTYVEYRPKYLNIGIASDAQAIAVYIGEGEGKGSSRIMLNTGDAETDIVMYDSASATGTVPTVLWQGTHAANTVVVTKGSLGIGFYAGEATVIEDLTIGSADPYSAGPKVVCGDDVDVDDIIMNSGSLVINGYSADAIETFVQNGGTSTINGTDGVDSLVVRGGTCYFNSTGTLGGAPTVSGDGVIDFSQDPRAKTVTNPIEVYGDSSQVNDPVKVVGSLVVDYNETTRFANLGRNLRVTRGATA